MATTVQCPDGHTNQGTRTLCGVCGGQLPFPAEWGRGGSLYERVGFAKLAFGVAALVIGAIVALAIFSQKGGNSTGSSGGYTAAYEPTETYDSTPASTQDDWYRMVCQLGTINPAGKSALRGAVAGDICTSSDGGILIGKYASSLARDNDIAAFRGKARYATMADDQGFIWLFVAFTPRASAAVQSLRQFGFSVG